MVATVKNPKAPIEKEEPEETTAKGANNSKTLVLIMAVVIGLLLLIGGTTGILYLTGVIGHKEVKTSESSPTDAKNPDETATEQSTEVANHSDKPAVYYKLGDLIVNISGESKRPNYLKLTLSLELNDEKDVAIVESFKPRLINNFQIYLRELRVEDLRGTAGIYRLQAELLKRVNETLQPVSVRDVLFQDMLVQ